MAGAGDGDQKALRRYERERRAASLARTHRVERLRRAHDANWPGPDGQPRHYGYTIMPLVLAALPVKPVPYKQIFRRVEMPGSFALHITLTQARSDRDLPFGNDSHVLNYLTTYADPTGFVPLSTAAQYLSFAGMTNSPTNRADLSDRLARLAGFQISVHTPSSAPIDAGESALILRWRLPRALKDGIVDHAYDFDDDAQPEGPCGIWLNPAFVGQRSYHQRIPFPIQLMQECRKDHLVFRLMLLLSWRSFVLHRQFQRAPEEAPSVTLLPWPTLASALGSQAFESAPVTAPSPRAAAPRVAVLGLENSSVARRGFRRDVARALADCRLIWRELEARVTEDGILVRVPRDARHLLPDALTYIPPLLPNPRRAAPRTAQMALPLQQGDQDR